MIILTARIGRWSYTCGFFGLHRADDILAFIKEYTDRGCSVELRLAP